MPVNGHGMIRCLVARRPFDTRSHIFHILSMCESGRVSKNQTYELTLYCVQVGEEGANEYVLGKKRSQMHLPIQFERVLTIFLTYEIHFIYLCFYRLFIVGVQGQ